jgi:hypothetical protein
VRPPVEHYLRCSVTIGDIVVEPGLELRAEDDDPAIAFMLKCLQSVATSIGKRAIDGPRMKACAAAEMLFEVNWPGRAWFVELHDAKLESWTQTFQPYGVPMNR